jgi:hypothetical protein
MQLLAWVSLDLKALPSWKGMNVRDGQWTKKGKVAWRSRLLAFMAKRVPAHSKKMKQVGKLKQLLLSNKFSLMATDNAMQVGVGFGLSRFGEFMGTPAHPPGRLLNGRLGSGRGPGGRFWYGFSQIRRPLRSPRCGACVRDIASKKKGLEVAWSASRALH